MVVLIIELPVGELSVDSFRRAALEAFTVLFAESQIMLA
jgi:hypothetical protein